MFMKQHFKYLSFLLLFALSGVMNVSCGDDDDEPVDVNNPSGNQSGSETNTGTDSGANNSSNNETGKEPAKEQEPVFYVDVDTVVVEPHLSKVVGELHVDGRYLKDEAGNIVNLHGMAQTYSPWFNSQSGKNFQWGDYDVSGCLRVNQGRLKKIIDNGWSMDFVRLHMDPHWTVTNKNDDQGEKSAHLYYDEEKFKKYLDEVFVPMAEYIQSLGMRVLMRPPGVCPERISYGDAYYKYMLDVWTIVANHPKLQNNPLVMFELANEPVYFVASDGSDSQRNFNDIVAKEYSQFFQDIVDKMRGEGCNNILWVPGLAWQQDYRAFQKYPIEGDNIGYAVHCYPGWYGSDCYQQTGEIAPDMWRGSAGGYKGFKKDWDNSITNVVGQTNPIIVTEMDWCSKKFKGRTWGSSVTGTAGGKGFGANFRKIMDETGNVSWLTFVWDYDLAAFNPKHKVDSNNFLYDPDSGVLPVYWWFKEYWDAEN